MQFSKESSQPTYIYVITYSIALLHVLINSFLNNSFYLIPKFFHVT